jgi:hypothetical protein
MQILAMLSMTSDHFGRMFVPHDPLWQFIGRLAFPIYTYLLVIGYQRTRDVRRYFLRLLLIGVLAQIPYMMAIRPDHVNVIGTLILGLLVLFALDRLKSVTLKILLVSAAMLLLEVFRFDYGFYGILLLLIYRYTSRHVMVTLHLVLNIAAVFINGPAWILQMGSLASTLLIAYFPSIVKWIDRIRIPKWMWRSFYPAHFVALLLIRYFFRS